MRILLILLFLFRIHSALSQDTLIFHFNVGKANLSLNDQGALTNLPSQYDLSSVDSVWYIGFADSTGNYKSNFKLSEKRAENTFKASKSFFEKNLPYKILAKGETIRNENWESRRVEMIIYYKPTLNEQEEVTIIENADPKCFYVDFEALEYCHVREITKGNRKYVQIEALNIPLLRERKHYYVLNGSGNKATIQRLNWKLKTTGKSWWKKERLVATIPKSGFDKFQFFTLADPPCSGCTETILTKDTIILTLPQYYPDVFLMDNLQMNVGLFGHKVKLRAPREYIDLPTDYFISNYPTSNNLNSKIKWEEKRGKINQDYYFTTIRSSLSLPFYIKKMGYTTFCRNDYSYLKYRGSGILCATAMNGSVSIAGALQPGVFYHNDTLTSYFTAGIFLKGLFVHGGVNHRGGFYGGLNYKRNLFSIPMRSMSIKNNWTSIYDKPSKFRYINFYAGVDLRTNFNKNYWSFVESNLHIGTHLFHVWTKNFDVTGFLQGGCAYDFLRKINDKIYPYAEFGIRFYFVLS